MPVFDCAIRESRMRDRIRTYLSHIVLDDVPFDLEHSANDWFEDVVAVRFECEMLAWLSS